MCILPSALGGIDWLYVQAALFAGFLSAFLIELLGRLEPDPMDIIQDVLIYQTQMMRNSSLGPYVPAEFSPPEHIVIVNALFYASLGFMILAAFIAMLIKSWVREFDRGLRAMSLPEQRAKTREFRYLGMERWKLPEMVGILPLLIQISLLLFSIGLILFLFHISKPSFGVTTGIFGIGVLYYAITTSISVFVTSSPFHSPLSRTLGKVYQHMHAHFCPRIYEFLSETMDMTPETSQGRVRRDIQVILQKSRPYPEKDFVAPITEKTIDEIQLSTAASALKRIHDSAPDSQYSEALQSSVWQVAGGAVHRSAPLFHLPSWIRSRNHDEEYFSPLPPAILAGLVAISLRARRKYAISAAAIRVILQHIGTSNDPWPHIVIGVYGLVFDKHWTSHDIEQIGQVEPSDLTGIIRKKGLSRDECLWLLSTLSELCSDGFISAEEPSLIGICLAILMHHATKWDLFNPPDIVLLDAVVTLAAISCSPEKANQLNILSSSRDYPWLLLNIRNTNLIPTLYQGSPSDNHKQLTSLLLLIVYGLLYRESFDLAVTYFIVITAQGDLPFYASALTAIAPAMTELGLSTMGKMLVTPRIREVPLGLAGYILYDRATALEEMFNHYDEQLGVSENPDPNLLSILLIISKHMGSWEIYKLQNRNLDLRNSWLGLAARVIARRDIPDGFGLPIGLFYDHRLHIMISALSLLRYTEGNVTHYTESLLLASFLQSRELAISSVALEHYMRSIISYSNPPAPSCYLSAAVSSAFNVMLPEEQIWKRWTILDIFVGGSETLSLEWRRMFAEGFFTLSRRSLPRLRVDTESSTSESELEAILTWEYFHEEEQEPVLTDSHFSGLDWMAMAWSLHLSQHSGRKIASSRQGKSQMQNWTEPVVNEEIVFTALSKLLDAAPYYLIIPIIPKLREFMQWFDDTEFPEYHSTTSAQVNEAVRRHEEFQMLHRFRKFSCIWYI